MPGGGYVEIPVWDQKNISDPVLIGAPPSMVLFYGDIILRTGLYEEK